jgi:hypothetical protein
MLLIIRILRDFLTNQTGEDSPDATRYSNILTPFVRLGMRRGRGGSATTSCIADDF